MPSDYLPDLPAFVPSIVQERLRTIHDIAKERNAAARSHSEEFRAVRNDLMVAQERLRELERAGPKNNQAAIVQMQDKIARLEADVAKLRAQLDRLDPSWKAAHALSENLLAYVRAHAAGGIEVYRGPMPQLEPGERARDAIERAERRTRMLLADRREVMAAPFPSALLKKLAREQLLARAEAAKPDVTGLIDRCEPVRFPMSRVALELHGGGSMDLFSIDPIGLAAWMQPDVMQAAIEREIDAMSEDAIALTPSERIERLATIDGDILASEREEAAFAELAGLLPRSDIDPRAALNLSAEMPAPERDGK